MSYGKRAVLLCLIVLMGFGLRLGLAVWGQSYHYFAIGDEINAYGVAEELGAGVDRARYLGQQHIPFTTAHAPGPLWALYWLLGSRFGGSVQGVILLTVLLNTAVIYLVYRLAREFWGGAAGLWAALFTAAAPWAAYFSVGGHNPMVMGFLGGLLYLSLWRVCTEPGSPQVFWAAFILAIMPQFHMVGPLLIPAVLVVLFLARARLNRAWLAAGAIAGAAAYWPYLEAEAANGWLNTRDILSGAGSGWQVESLKALIIPPTLLTNLVPRWTGYQFSDYLAFGRAVFGTPAVLLVFNGLSIVLAGLSIWALAGEFGRAMKGRWARPREAFQDRPGVVFLTVMLAGPLLVYLLKGLPFAERYGIIQFPLLFLVPALFVVKVLPRLKRARLIRAGLVLSLAFNLVLIPAFSLHLARTIDSGPIFIPSFRQMEGVRQTILKTLGRSDRYRIRPEPYLEAVKGDREAFRGGEALARYINLREKYDPRRTGPESPRLLTLVKSGNVPPGDRVAYRINDLAIVMADGPDPSP